MIARFPTLRLEGGLISSDQIDRVADQKAKEFTIDDIAAAWSDVRSYWSIFEKSLAKLPEDNLATSETRNRWMMPFFSTLGYDLSSPRVAAEVDGQTYAISHRAGKDDNSTPIHIVGFRQSLDRRPDSGRPRLAPHSLVQEYLNRTEHLWGIVTNGSTLRILRNSNLLRKQAYIEFDLEQIMRDELFADFALLFRLIHASRLPKGIDDASSCQLELFHKQTVEQGGRVRDHLRDGVEKALTQFGNGFLNHPRNATLRAKVQDKSLEPFDFYEQLLRLIYRFLFLMVSEERNLISDNMTYRQHYSVSRIRRLVEVRAAYTNQEDLWLSLALTFKLFQDESLGPLLSVPTLNGDLFDPARTSELNESSLSNRDLLLAMWEICMYREKVGKNKWTPWRKINYAALDVEELGSVYESLLEFQPVFVEQNGKHGFALLTGTERKSTGSYYTPPELVNELIQSALEPVMKDRIGSVKNLADREATLLSITVCDPACGSGHFLLAAARSIGRELAKARTGDEEPAPEQMRIAIRDTITHCIYGVDKNPLAVDLCKVALWLEGHTKSKPLTFLDHRIRCGDSLIGVFDLKVLEEGIPDEAYTAVTGDDKSIAKDLKKLNSEHLKREKQNRSLTEFDPAINILTASREQVNAISDEKPEDIRKKKELFTAFQQEGTPWCKDKNACYIWTAAFFISLTKENLQERRLPTSETLREYLVGGLGANASQIQITRQYAKKHKYFHWYLEFPEVFIAGGFDCVLGNPPWERIKLEEQEFFATRDIAIANAQNKASRVKLIELLKRGNPDLAIEFHEAKHASDAESKFVRISNRFPLSARGDINSYPLFSELSNKLRKKIGRAGIIVPTGIATDDSLKFLFADLLENKQLIELIGFINTKKIFPAIKDYIKFCLLVLGKSDHTEFMFLLTETTQIKDKTRRFSLSASDLKIINPNTKTAPILRNQTDAKLISFIYKNVPILINEQLRSNPWAISFMRMFDMSNDSHLFLNQESTQTVPLYEAKMIFHFDHRFSTYENATESNINEGNLPQCTPEMHIDPTFRVKPRYWLPRESLVHRLDGQTIPKWYIGFRGIAAGANERTMISSIVPPIATGNSFPIFNTEMKNAILLTCFYSNFNSMVVDFVARLKVGGPNLNFFIVKQLPILAPERYSTANIAFIVPRALELIYTSWDIKAFADDVWRCADDAMKAMLNKQWEANKSATGGHEWNPPEWAEIEKDGISLPPFKWDEERRAVLRAELEVLYAQLYGLSRDELRYILDPADVYGPEFPGETFRVLKEKEIKKYGEYRTQRLVLEAWDRMEAKR